MPVNPTGWVVDDAARLAALAEYGILDTPAEPSFDDIVFLATQICETPVALVSFVDLDRQWFKARIGFEPAETDLSRSVCAYVLAEADLLVIPDLSQDDRTRDNPLVAEAPHIRFYAGAPLRTKAGQPLGSLCVIDTAPRPQGLTDRQAAMLRALARQVMEHMEVRRILAEREALLAERQQIETKLIRSEAGAKTSEAYWRGLFERLTEGFMVGEVVRDASGQVTDWRSVDANAAWSQLLGVPAEAAIGRTIRDVFPGIEEGWITQLAPVVDAQKTVSFTQPIGSLRRWFEGRAFPLHGDQFGIVLLDVTERVDADARRAALLEIGDRLREARTGAEMARMTSEIVGRTIGASRAGFGRLDKDAEGLEVDPDWTVDGVPSIAGYHRFADYGDLRRELLRGEPLVIDDVRSDPRTAGDPSALLAVGIAALVNMPVREHDKTVAVLIVHDTRPRRWTLEVIAFLRNSADRLEASVARLKAQADQQVLNNELSHRLKNTFAMVQAIATQTLRDAQDRPAVDAFRQRILALSKANDVLVQQSWTSASMRAVIEAVLQTFENATRFDLEGADVVLGPRATLSLSLLLHELGTNAVKYGALSNETGRVSVTWRLEQGARSPDLVLDWRETGGPPAAPPKIRSFGSRLIQMGLVGTGGVDLRYDKSGFSAQMRAPLDEVQQS